MVYPMSSMVMDTENDRISGTKSSGPAIMFVLPSNMHIWGLHLCGVTSAALARIFPNNHLYAQHILGEQQYLYLQLHSIAALELSVGQQGHAIPCSVLVMELSSASLLQILIDRVLVLGSIDKRPWSRVSPAFFHGRQRWYWKIRDGRCVFRVYTTMFLPIDTADRSFGACI